MPRSRIYIVKDGKRKFYVRAALKAQALHFVAETVFKVEIANERQLKEVFEKGIEVLDSRPELVKPPYREVL